MNIFSYMLNNKKKMDIARKGVLALILVLIVTSLLGGVAMSTKAAGGYGSWIVGDPATGQSEGERPATGTDEGAHDADTQQKKVSTVESFVAWLIAAPGYAFDEAMRSTGIDCSVGGVVMGRLTDGGSDYFKFSLEDSNFYGTVGATLYIGIRAMAMAAIMFFSIAAIIKSLFYSDVKSFTELKQAIIGGIVAIIVMLLMPQMVDFACKARDTLSVWFYNMTKEFTGMQGATLGETMNIANTYRSSYEEHSDLVNAIIYTAVCFLPITWIVNYTKIAVTELVLFGSFPLFCSLSARDKKAMGNWLSVFITNLFIPAIDIALLMLPQVIIAAMETGLRDGAISDAGTAQYVGWNLLKAIITITTFMFIVPARDQLLKLLGNHMGVQMGGGLFAAGAAIGGAAKGAIDGAKDMAKGLGGLVHKDNDGGDDPAGDEKGSENPSTDEASDSIGGKGMDPVEESPDNNDMDNMNGDEQPDDGNNEDEGGNGLTEEEQAADNELESTAAGDDPDMMDESDNGSDETLDEATDNELESTSAGDSDADGADMPDGADDIENGYGDPGAEDGVGDMDGGADESDAPSDMPSDVSDDAESAGADGDEGMNSDMPSDPGSGADDSMGEESSEADMPSQEGSDMGSAASEDAESGDISQGAPADMPSDGTGASSDEVSNDVDNSIGDATVSSADLAGEGGLDSKGDDNLENLGNAVKENSPAEMADFNMDRAANLATMDNIKESMDGLDETNDRLKAESNDFKAQIASNNAEIANTRAEQKAFVDEATAGGTKEMSAVDKAKNDAMNAKVDGLKKENRSLATKGIEHEKQIAHNEAVKAGMGKELARRGGIEKQNAQKAATMTGNSAVFKSSADMVKSLKHDNNMRKMANYKNYNASEFKGTMTNQQRAEYARTQKRAEAAGQVASGAAKAARAYATAMATVAMMGGGADVARDTGKQVSEASKGWAGSMAAGAEYVASGDAAKDVKQKVQNAKTAAGNAKSGMQKAGQYLAEGKLGRDAVAGAFNTGRAVKSGAQAAAQKTVDTVKAVPKVPGKVVGAGAKAVTATGKAAVANFNSAKDQIKEERRKSAPGPTGQGKSSGKSGSGSSKNSGKDLKGQSNILSGNEKAESYAKKNAAPNDPINASREAQAKAKAEKDVSDFKSGK